eukprot:gene9190-9272_t
MPSLLALAAALGWASGFRLYAVVFLVGMMGVLGWMPLPPGLAMLQHPLVLMVSGFMLMVEFFADKVPWVDSAWDAIHAFIRVPAGAALAYGVFGADNATMAVVAGLLGGSLSATALATKMTTRAAVNTSPEPFSNWGLSFFEDGLVVAVVWLATQHPVAFGIALVVMVAVSVLLMVVLFKFLRAVRTSEGVDPFSRRDGFHTHGVVQRRFEFEFGGEHAKALLTYERGGGLHLKVGEGDAAVSGSLVFGAAPQGAIELQFAGQRTRAAVYAQGEVDHVFTPLGATQITAIDLLAHAGEAAAEGGRLTELLYAPGDQVTEGAELLKLVAADKA